MMNTDQFKTIFFILLSIVIVSCADAEESTEESLTVVNEQEADNQSSWWENSKNTLSNIWQSSTQAVSDLLKQSPEEKEALFAHIWDKITLTLDKLLILEKENETLPDSAWFGKDKKDNHLKINQLLDEAVAILSLSHTDQIRQQIRALENKIQDIKQTISQYRQAQVSAPIRSTWETTVADYDKKINRSLKQIEHYQNQIDTLKMEFAQKLSEQGLYITQEQLEVLLSSVVGDDIIQSSIVYDNVKQISQQLMTLTINSGEDLNISQRYYGMYMILLKTLLHMQQSFMDRIDQNYLPKINQIMLEIQTINATTQNLLRHEANENRRQYLQANLEAQDLTLQTARLYRQHLTQQRGKIKIAKDKIKADLNIAQNTYKTVRVSGELVNLLRTSQKSFDLLLNIQVPELLVFKNLEMKQEFAILTQKLAQ